MSSVFRESVKLNAKKRGNVGRGNLRPKGRATGRQLVLSSNGRTKEHTSEKKREKRGRRCLLTRLGRKAFILESEANKDK